LYFLLCQHPENNHILRPFLKPLMAYFKSSWVDEPSVNLGPSGSWRNAILLCIFERCDAFSDMILIFGEFLPRRLENALRRCFRLLRRGRFDSYWLSRTFNTFTIHRSSTAIVLSYGK
jgi:hypothetical protein